MHEKQVLIYFVIDNEGVSAKMAQRLLAKKRQFHFPGLERVIPEKDRLCLWKTSFEGDNFEPQEISRALRLQGINVSSTAVRKKQESWGPGEGKALIDSLAAGVDKRRLAVDLAENLIKLRMGQKDSPKRPIESFVETSGALILRNFQALDEEHLRRNFGTHLMG